ncbi:MAG: 3-deoxy-D-manno-octulosonic-acid transferase [Cycloclasticus sp.]
MSDEKALAQEVVQLLQHPEKRDKMGSAGHSFVEQNRGAVKKITERIVEIINASS